jgi:hypothetical protein
MAGVYVAVTVEVWVGVGVLVAKVDAGVTHVAGTIVGTGVPLISGVGFG